MFRQFWLIIFIRLLLIAISSGLAAYFWLADDYPINKWLWIGVTVIVTAETCRYIFRIIDSIDQYVNGVLQNDFSAVPFAYQRWGKLKKLREKLEQVSKQGQSTKMAKSEDFEKFSIALDIAPVGFLAWNEDGKILLLNNYTKDILSIDAVLSIDRLRQLRPVLLNKLEKLSIGYSGILRYKSEDEEVKLGARKSTLKIGNELHTMVVLQSLNKEIENVESDAWERLMKIMTHEIMNSITSVNSLSSTLISLLESSETESAKKAARSIQNRSSGLLRFVQDYRTLSEIPSPNIQEILLKDFIDEFIEEVEKINPSIDIISKIIGKTKIKADPDQLSLVLTNLYLNSAYALDVGSDPRIEIKGKILDDHIQLSIIDNGKGMDKETLDNAFIPFYTTRSTGSGIGLPLSRQLLRAMNGRLTLESEFGQGTEAKIYLPKA